MFILDESPSDLRSRGLDVNLPERAVRLSSRRERIYSAVLPRLKAPSGRKGLKTRDLSARERDARVKRIGLFSSRRTYAPDSHFADEGEVRRKRDVK